MIAPPAAIRHGVRQQRSHDRRLWQAVLAIAAVATVLANCHARDGDLYDRVFACDPSAPTNTCGTTKSGAPLTCFAGQDWGAANFCCESCSGAGPIDDNFVCQQSARLQKCDPASSAPRCPNTMTCTNLGNGEGACMLPCPGGGCRDGGNDGVVPDGSIDLEASALDSTVMECTSQSRCMPRAGKDQVCYPIKSIGGTDFCVDACVPTQPVADPEHFVCLQPGTLLRLCSPDNPTPQADCPGHFECYRTRLTENRGVCLWKMQVCAGDRDCGSTDSLSQCASSVIQKALSIPPEFNDSLHIRLDHLNCVHPQCSSLSSKCTETEGCLGNIYAGIAADLCVPRCDGSLFCPPNYSCGLATSGPQSNLCLPGVYGVRCLPDECIVGTCDDTGAGFSVCAMPCATTDDCSVLGSEDDVFVCASGGGRQHCVSTRPFHGANCQVEQAPGVPGLQASDCPNGQFCSQLNGFGNSMELKHGECRVPCKDDGTCDPMGGVPMTCVGRLDTPYDKTGGCFPGELGTPCLQQSECVSGLSCLDVPEEPGIEPAAKRCTVPCQIDGGTEADGDASCDQVQRANHRGYCGTGFVCRARRVANMPCDRDNQCLSIQCNAESCQ